MAAEEGSDSKLFQLVQAAFDGSLENVKEFVCEDNVNRRCKINGHDSATALGLACWAGNVEIVRFLLSFGADVGVKSDDSTPLHLACDEGHLEVVEILLANGANIEDTDWYHRTPLHRACDSGHNEVVLTLLKHGADVGTMDDDKWTPLHICRSGKVARTLLENGADANACDLQGFTPLARMSISDEMDRVSILLDYAAGSGIPCGLQHSKFDRTCNKTVLMCCYTSCHEEIFRGWLSCFEKYFIKSKLAKFNVSEVEKPVDPPEAGTDWSQSERDAYAEQCMAELLKMDMETIGNTTATYFSLLTRNICILRGQRILGSIQWDNCYLKYPIYSNMIRCSYQSLLRFFLKDLCLEFFSLTPDYLPIECAEMVLDYLTNKDLETIAFEIVGTRRSRNL